MPSHNATVRWTNQDTVEDFTKGKYNRAHEWAFDGGQVVRVVEPDRGARAAV